MKLGVFIGRFQPFHNGHLHVVREALGQVDKLLILVGSATEPRTTFNPWTYEEREEMISEALPDDLLHRVEIEPLPDSPYSNTQWQRSVQDQVGMIVDHECGGHAEVILVGHKKDGTSFYLDMFPQWGSIGVESYGEGLSATTLREEFFADGETLRVDDVRIVAAWCETWRSRNPRTYDRLRAEYRGIRLYLSPYAGLEYPPIFVTTDAVVVRSGHVLLVKRGRSPGKGLWALPGGFLEAKSRIEDNMLDELEQETAIAVSRDDLRHHIRGSRVFDAVYRSARGRTITHAFLIHWPNGPLPEVQGRDDAADAHWWPISQLDRGIMFEDHYSVSQALIATLDR